jgi:hypothetical protein
MQAILASACAAVRATLVRRDSTHFDGDKLSESGLQILLAATLETLNPALRVMDEYRLDAGHFPDLALFPAQGALAALVEIKYVRLGFVEDGRGQPDNESRLQRSRRIGHLRLLLARQTWDETARLKYWPLRGDAVAIATVLTEDAVPQVRRYADLVARTGAAAPETFVVLFVGDMPFLFAVTSEGALHVPLPVAAAPRRRGRPKRAAVTEIMDLSDL